MGDNLQAHELIRHEFLREQGLTTQRHPDNPSIALDLDHHTRGPRKDTRGIGGVHFHEGEIRARFGLGRNEFFSSIKRELDITSGALRKAGVPKKIIKRLRKRAEAFYKNVSGTCS